MWHQYHQYISFYSQCGSGPQYYLIQDITYENKMGRRMDITWRIFGGKIMKEQMDSSQNEPSYQQTCTDIKSCGCRTFISGLHSRHYIHLYVYVNRHILVHTFIHAYIDLSIYVCISVYTDICEMYHNLFTDINICAFVYTDIYDILLYIFTYVSMYMCICRCI